MRHFSDKYNKVTYDSWLAHVQMNDLKVNLEKMNKAHALQIKNKTRSANDKHYDKFKQANYA
ncbi:hypothetical protein B9T31_05850 [Acinetobacter sp. ANC 4558]|uniref:hypothetical protein n=1 Tax=Acinetobacter sp. ANC 4558 TaxID=1977876 RepID=UPI000A3568AF|nr:hypothetical protein [Acinetobacter sp. ANC 4558]OTG87129.1 hypothetical protein B9T31_05850 [Acinetobacter sp. ANC 4558]